MSAAPAKPSRSPRGELALIAEIRRRAAATQPRRSAVQLGIGDDCAILRPPAGHEVVVTTDFSLETRHFTRDRHSPHAIGHRTLARGLSDLAAMGAQPLAAFLSLAITRDLARNSRWINSFLDGLTSLARLTHTPLAGGDTSQSPGPHVLADIVLLGSLPAGTALRRDTARPDDLLFCTGALGGAAAELDTLLTQPLKPRRTPAPDTTAHPHLYPQPRLRTGQLLRQRRLATACLDLSDGLSTDLAHLCEASGVSAELDLAQLPPHPLTQALSPEEALHHALHGGEDYELLFTARPNTRIPAKLGGIPLTQIGRITRRKSGQPLITQIDAAGHRCALEPAGWEHLR